MAQHAIHPYAASRELLQCILPKVIRQTGPGDTEGILNGLTQYFYALILYTPVPAHQVSPGTYQAKVAEYLERGHGIFCFDFHGHHMGVLCFKNESEEKIRERILVLEHEISGFLQDYLCSGGVEINLSIGRPFLGLMHLQDSYSELINSAMTFSIRPGELVVSEYDIVNDPTLMGNPYPRTEIERQLADAVLKLEIRKAKRIMEEIVQHDMSTLRLKLSFLPRMSTRLEWILTVLHVPRNSGDAKSAEIYNYPHYVQFAEGIDHGVELIYEFFDKLDEYYNAFRFNIGKDISQITDYIKDHANDPNLSATMICDRFRISPSYLSHMFKKRTGIKLVDYIHMIRIEQAKTLLEDGSIPIAEIARQVGYTSSASFSTTFKKYESRTPRECRENYLRNH